MQPRAIIDISAIFSYLCVLEQPDEYTFSNDQLRYLKYGAVVLPPTMADILVLPKKPGHLITLAEAEAIYNSVKQSEDIIIGNVTEEVWLESINEKYLVLQSFINRLIAAYATINRLKIISFDEELQQYEYNRK